MFLRPPEGAEFLGSVAPAQVPSGGLTVPLQADFTQAQLGSSLRTYRSKEGKQQTHYAPREGGTSFQEMEISCSQFSTRHHPSPILRLLNEQR